MHIAIAFWVGLSAALVPQAGVEKECLEIARNIEESMSEDKGAWLDAHFDAQALLERVLKDAPGSDKFKADFRADFLKGGLHLGQKWSAALTEKGQYKFLRLRMINGKPRILFRVLMGGGLNYHDFLLEPSAKGVLRPVDLNVMVTGELFSETLRRMYVGAAAAEPGALGKMVGRENEYAQNLPKIQKMTALRNEGKPAEVLKIYDALPASLKKDKYFLIQRLGAASEVGVKEAVDALDAFRTAFPGDPALGILSLDVHLNTKKYDLALKALDDIEKAVGGDAYLLTMKGSVHVMAGTLDKARAAAIQAVEMEKTLDTGYWIVVNITLKEKKFAETAQWLTRIEKDLGLKIGDLNENALYKEFIKSPEYAAWMEARKQ